MNLHTYSKIAHMFCPYPSLSIKFNLMHWFNQSLYIKWCFIMLYTKYSSMICNLQGSSYFSTMLKIYSKVLLSAFCKLSFTHT